jgi:hypothetical protein
MARSMSPFLFMAHFSDVLYLAQALRTGLAGLAKGQAAKLTTRTTNVVFFACWRLCESWKAPQRRSYNPPLRKQAGSSASHPG